MFKLFSKRHEATKGLRGRNALKTRKLGMEGLEDRTVMSSMSVTGGVLNLYGDSWNNNALVEIRNGAVYAEIVSTPAGGFSLTADRVNRTYSQNSITSIRFWGNDGNDRFVSNWSRPSTAWGGAGNDYLEGANGVDTFYGGDGNDELKGYGGNDNLYGGNGNDVLYGMVGNDGLYGGAGDDRLYGGDGADRFLMMSGQSEVKDAAAQDAIVYFRNDTKVWNAAEIEQVDAGLRVLHERTGNDNLLETSTSGPITFWRGGSSIYAGLNTGSGGKIVIYDGGLKNTDTTVMVTIHEIGHNWDTEHSSWNKWRSLSGWRQTSIAGTTKSGDGEWYYSTSASFARSYGKTNPREDFCTAWESYFTYRNNLPNSMGVSRLSSAKLAHLDAFFASLS